MSITVACTCGKKYRVKPEQQGKTLRCPACQQLVTVPAALDELIPIDDDPASLPPWNPGQRRAKPKENLVDADSGLVPCQNCGKPVDVSMSACRHCGFARPQRSIKKWRDSDSEIRIGLQDRYEMRHQGGQLLGAAIFGVFCCGIPIGLAVTGMAIYHLHLMNAGRMDPAGKTLTMIGLGIAIFDIFGAILALWLMSTGAMPGFP